MAEINLTLNIDTEQMEALLKEGLLSLPQDKIQEILLEVVKNILKDKDSGVLFVSQGFYEKEYKPSELLKGIIEKAQVSPYIEELSNTIIDYLKENYEDIIYKSLVNSVIQLLFGPKKQLEIYENLQAEIYMNKAQIETRLNNHGI